MDPTLDTSLTPRSGSEFGPRPEATALRWDDLLSTTQSALEELLHWLDSAASKSRSEWRSATAAGDPHGTESRIQGSEEQLATSVLVSGDRGFGKTTILLSTAYALRARQEFFTPSTLQPLTEKARARRAARVGALGKTSEISALYAVQNALRRAVGLRALVVEVNPSSNLLIGDLLDLRNHPILRLNPPERREGELPPVPIAVGSDDPLTFSTWLLREYTLLFEAALSAGYSERAAYEWLQRIQRTGLDARFTVAWRPTADALAGRLLDELSDYLQRPRPREPVGNGAPHW